MHDWEHQIKHQIKVVSGVLYFNLHHAILPCMHASSRWLAPNTARRRSQSQHVAPLCLCQCSLWAPRAALNILSLRVSMEKYPPTWHHLVLTLSIDRPLDNRSRLTTGLWGLRKNFSGHHRRRSHPIDDGSTRPGSAGCRSKLRARRPVRKLRQVGSRSTCDDADETSILKHATKERVESFVHDALCTLIWVQGLKIRGAAS
jgi:hypothetical protein